MWQQNRSLAVILVAVVVEGCREAGRGRAVGAVVYSPTGRCGHELRGMLANLDLEANGRVLKGVPIPKETLAADSVGVVPVPMR